MYNIYMHIYITQYVLHNQRSLLLSLRFFTALLPNLIQQGCVSSVVYRFLTPPRDYVLITSIHMHVYADPSIDR